MSADRAADLGVAVTPLIRDNAGAWDIAGEVPRDLLRKLAGEGLFCAEVPADHGGLGFSSQENGRLTAHIGSLCSSLRSVMTSHGMAAWTVQRLGDRHQRAAYLPLFTGGELAAVGFSEPNAGSDLSAMTASLTPDGDHVIVDGDKKWVTAAAYADHLIIFARHGTGAAAVVVPASAPGVTIEPVPQPMGCRAAGHATVKLRGVRVPATALLGGGDMPLPLLVTTALSYGRISVAWGCVGILRACLDVCTAHARTRRQFGRLLAEHQLVARHLAELLVSERTATLACERASHCWDTGSSEMVIATVLAKHVGAREAAQGAAAAVQVMASAGAQDGHVVARAYRDAKLMEIIEGTNELCQVILSQHALAR
ncbi:acyl-CoA dehydrogenase family protein [Micromonospora parva]|uniref:acyl-CoA dehydrogenase family protein n=1 Tax=Micromonospora parva TaxID=1464048 RepID=UPI003404BAC4